MELIYITFSKISDKLIKASLSVFNDKKARHIFEVQGVSRKQCAYNLCKQGFVSWDLFSELKEMAQAQDDPRRHRVSRFQGISNRIRERREQRLADICDDLNCSVYEATQLLDHGVHP